MTIRSASLYLFHRYISQEEHVKTCRNKTFDGIRMLLQIKRRSPFYSTDWICTRPEIRHQRRSSTLFASFSNQLLNVLLLKTHYLLDIYRCFTYQLLLNCLPNSIIGFSLVKYFLTIDLVTSVTGMPRAIVFKQPQTLVYIPGNWTGAGCFGLLWWAPFMWVCFKVSWSNSIFNRDGLRLTNQKIGFVSARCVWGNSYLYLLYLYRTFDINICVCASSG